MGISGELLFYGGVVLMSAAGVGTVITLITLRITGERLRKQLETEFGKKRR